MTHHILMTSSMMKREAAIKRYVALKNQADKWKARSAELFEQQAAISKSLEEMNWGRVPERLKKELDAAQEDVLKAIVEESTHDEG